MCIYAYPYFPVLQIWCFYFWKWNAQNCSVTNEHNKSNNYLLYCFIFSWFKQYKTPWSWHPSVTYNINTTLIIINKVIHLSLNREKSCLYFWFTWEFCINYKTKQNYFVQLICRIFFCSLRNIKLCCFSIWSIFGTNFCF